MEFKQFDHTYIVRLEPGEEIHATLKAFCQQQVIRAGWLTGIGAVRQAQLGYFSRERKEYSWREINTDHELTSLMGNISLKDGETWLHLHATLSDENYQVIAGHLRSGVISVTGEIVIHTLDDTLERRHYPEFNSFLLDLKERGGER